MNKNLTDLVSIQAFYLAHDNGIISSSRNTKEELAEHFLDLVRTNQSPESTIKLLLEDKMIEIKTTKDSTIKNYLAIYKDLVSRQLR